MAKKKKIYNHPLIFKLSNKDLEQRFNTINDNVQVYQRRLRDVDYRITRREVRYLLHRRTSCKIIRGTAARTKIIRYHDRWHSQERFFDWEDDKFILDEKSEFFPYRMLTKKIKNEIQLRRLLSARQFRNTFIKTYNRYRKTMWSDRRLVIHKTFLIEIKEWLNYTTQGHISRQFYNLPFLRGKKLYLVDVSIMISFFLVTYVLFFNPFDEYYLPIIFLAILYWNRALFVEKAHRNIAYFLFYVFVYVKCGLVVICLSIFILYPILIYTDFLRRPVIFY
jgi:hypothetical protein